MDNQELFQKIEETNSTVEASRKTIMKMLDIMDRMSNAIKDGFNEVNERLARLEGNEGMQGVNSQLGEIKNELYKIQKAYPYDELYKNIQSIQKGEA